MSFEILGQVGIVHRQLDFEGLKHAGSHLGMISGAFLLLIGVDREMEKLGGFCGADEFPLALVKALSAFHRDVNRALCVSGHGAAQRWPLI
jgi:hypothetical protein